MHSPYQKKRKLYNGDEFKPPNPPVAQNDNSDDWANDEMNDFLTQKENLDRIDELIATSQMFDNKKDEQNQHKMTLPPDYVDPSRERAVIIDLQETVETLKQSIYSKDGQVKFLRMDILKLGQKLQDQKNVYETEKREFFQKFERERLALQNELKSTKAQLEFKQHELNKSNFVQRSQANQYLNRTKSFGDNASSPIASNSFPDNNGFINHIDFMGRGKVVVREWSCQTGSEEEVMKKKMWSLQGKASPRLNVALTGGVLKLQSSLRHLANRLEYGETGCPENHQICKLKDGLRSLKYMKNPSVERILAMYHELVSKKLLCTGVEILQGGTPHPTKIARPYHINSNLLFFLEESATDLRSYLDILDRRCKLFTPGIAIPLRKKKKPRSGNLPVKPVNPMADVLTMVHSIITTCGPKEFEHMYEVPFFNQLINIIIEIANKESLDHEFEIVMMCLKIISYSLKVTKSETMTTSFASLMDIHGLVLRVLHSEDGVERKSESHDILCVLILEVLTSFTSAKVFKKMTCREINKECILALASSLMSNLRTKSTSMFPSIQRLFQPLVISLLLLRLKEGSNNSRENNPPCECISKAFMEVLLGLDELADMSDKSCPASQLNAIRGGMSTLNFIIERFPRMLKAKKGQFLFVSSALQKVFKKYEDTLTREGDYNELLILFNSMNIDCKANIDCIS